MAAKLMRMNGEVDVRAVLPSIQVPTLVMHRAGDKFIDIRHSRYLAEHIPGARLVELPGEETLGFGSGSIEAELDEIEEFLTGARHAPDPERILATVMFADIVDSTRRAAELGDRRWRDLLESIGGRGRARAAAVPRARREDDGRRVPGDLRRPRARRSAARRRSATWREAQFGIEVRTGLHTGEIEVIGDDVGGIAVHIGARVGGLARGERCWCPGPSRTSSSAPGSRSRTAASGS